MIITLFVGSAALAQQAAEPGVATMPSPEEMVKLQAMQEDIQGISSQLMQIQQATFASSEELQSDQLAFRELVKARMNDGGADVDATIERMNATQASLQGGGLDAEGQQAAMAQLQADSQTLQEAQAAAMAAPEVDAARIALEEKIVAAMQAQDPRTEALIAELETKQDAFDAAMAAVMEAASE